MTSIITATSTNNITKSTTIAPNNTNVLNKSTNATTTASAALIMKDLRAIEEEKGIIKDTTASNNEHNETELSANNTSPVTRLKQASTNTITSNNSANNNSAASNNKNKYVNIVRKNAKLDAGRSASSAITPKTTNLNGEDDNSSDNVMLLSSNNNNYNNQQQQQHKRSKSDEFLQLALGPVAATGTGTSNVGKSTATATIASSGVMCQSLDPEMEEQILFDQRLCEDTLGVAVRKINSNGKSQLRYVKCIALEEASVCTESNKSHFSLQKTFGRHKNKASTNAASSTGVCFRCNEYIYCHCKEQ